MMVSPRRGGQRVKTDGLADAEQSISSAMVPSAGTFLFVGHNSQFRRAIINRIFLRIFRLSDDEKQQAPRNQGLVARGKQPVRSDWRIYLGCSFSAAELMQ
jgi:hypothetical protein